MTPPSLTYVGGPTALLEVGGVRLLTDPTFDPPGAEFRAGSYVLRKTQGPALALESLGRVDAVLLSHDHHFDNLDGAGRALLTRVPRVLAPEAAADRLGGTAVGLDPWKTTTLPGPDRPLRVTATPARHGPAHLDRGSVIGFVLEAADAAPIYVSGDTVWYEGMAEVSRRFAAAPPSSRFTSKAGSTSARPRLDVEAAFKQAGLSSRLQWPKPGHPISLANHSRL